ncbi:hypothetical protein HFO39_24415 [Rhizobium leguminosarum]|uniref:hypothetical protein n=1 Tax=Rhizobium leguminosarum TaxID=384 RepID=UPI001C948AF2|nr:hypothetical protein [Rhizobium leguminosarum]MBY5637867.1 hypothetical protein [Rhizobium leguminosarum]MBY5728303.1 hypothetical protein [Rhizobium leguminosarum]
MVNEPLIRWTVIAANTMISSAEPAENKELSSDSGNSRSTARLEKEMEKSSLNPAALSFAADYVEFAESIASEQSFNEVRMRGGSSQPKHTCDSTAASS